MKTAKYVKAERRIAFSGHVYVIEFDTGVVKVGKAIDPEGRLAEHERTASVHGVSIVSRWVSDWHEDHSTTERHLIDFCARTGRRAGGHEHFRGVSFADARNFAEALIDSADVRAYEALDIAFEKLAVTTNPRDSTCARLANYVAEMEAITARIRARDEARRARVEELIAVAGGDLDVTYGQACELQAVSS